MRYFKRGLWCGCPVESRGLSDMAKKRKATTRKSTKTPARSRGKSAGKSAVAVQATPAQLGQRAGAQKLSPEDTVMALMIAVAIAIVLAALYLYQQNVKPKPAQAEPMPAMTMVMTG